MFMKVLTHFQLLKYIARRFVSGQVKICVRGFRDDYVKSCTQLAKVEKSVGKGVLGPINGLNEFHFRQILCYTFVEF